MVPRNILFKYFVELDIAMKVSRVPKSQRARREIKQNLRSDIVMLGKKMFISQYDNMSHQRGLILTRILFELLRAILRVYATIKHLQKITSETIYSNQNYAQLLRMTSLKSVTIEHLQKSILEMNHFNESFDRILKVVSRKSATIERFQKITFATNHSKDSSVQLLCRLSENAPLSNTCRN